MIALPIPTIASAEIAIEGKQRVLTVYTPFSIEMGSTDWNEFRRLRTRLNALVDPLLGGFDEVRIATLDKIERERRAIFVNALDDPAL